MKNKCRIAILANYPTQIHFNNVPHVSPHIAPWLVATHDAFKSFNEFDIHWIILCKKTKKELTLFEGGQTFHLIPRTRMIIGLCTAYILDRWKIRKCINRIQPDILHAWGTEDCYGLCAKDFKDKSILSIQGLLSAYKLKAKIKIFERLQARYEPSVLKSINFITTESEWAHDRVIEIAPDAHINILEYAVENKFFSVERKIDINPNCILACTNTPVKNVELAIRAFSDDRLKHIKLYIAGIEKKCYPGLPENIILLGKLSRDEMVKLLSKTWGVVHPSHADTGPTIVKEARVMRIPVVISKNCGSKRYIEEGKSGFIVSPHSVEELINGVLMITQNKETSITMGLHGSEACRLALSENTMINNLRQLYTAKLQGI